MAHLPPRHTSGAVAEGAHSEEQGDDKFRMEEGDGASHAQRIVGELYVRYERQLQRWRDYRNLLGFLLFVGLYLGVLYCQRGSETAYKVHSTIDAVITPSSDELQSPDDVYSWINGILTTVWQDPVCGDGICEVPFEYASYSTFGCRADCGKLSDRQNLTIIQVDLYYDFTHPAGSIPSSQLMAQAAWNLCPINTPYSTSCYYSSDNTFTKLSGESHQLITDSPDGQWDLVVKLDTFDKVQGAVRLYNKVLDSAYYFKVAIAALAAQTEQSFEVSILQNATTLAETPLMVYAAGVLATQYPASNITFLINQMLFASCACVSSNVLMNNSDTTTVFTSAQFYAAFNNSVGTTAGVVFDTTQSFATYSASYCPGSPVLSSLVYYQATDANNVTSTYNTSVVISGTNATALTAQCSLMLAQMLSFRANLTLAVQMDLLDLRLGDGSTTGKFAMRNLIQANLQTFLAATFPELVAPIFTTPAGLVLTDPVNATIAILIQAYVTGPHYLVTAQNAYNALTRVSVYNTQASLPSLVVLANARVAEVQYQMADTLAHFAVPLPQAWALDAGSNKNYTVGQVLSEFTTAGLTATFMPDPSTPLLNDFQISYNLANWTGNTTAYTICDLEDRGTSYVGNCTAMTVSCLVTTNSGQPYNCTNLLSGNNATVAGNLSSTSYRETCELPCDRKLDCNTVCECYGTCGLQQVCTCPACTGSSSVFGLPATNDPSFLSVEASASAGSGGTIASLSTVTSRKLQQSTTAQLNSVLASVSSVQTEQNTIAAQLTALQNQVLAANVLATQRALDQTLVNLIQSGNQEIQTGQQAVQAQLAAIIGQETAALTLATQAAATLASIENLANQQLTAQQSLATAVQAQLQSIRIATSTGTITMVQALAIYKRARRDQAATNKAALLANYPCTQLNTADNLFNLTTNGNVVDTTSARERNVGLTNRVIGGMLINQWRTAEVPCAPHSKYSTIENVCDGVRTYNPYGVDPVFKPGTTSYNPSFDDPTGVTVSGFYNCSALTDPTYNISVGNGTVTNPPPYCAELFNAESVPYAFNSFALEERPLGFPIYFDINLGGEAAQAWFTYVQEGLYLDSHTEGMSVELVTYNAPLRMFGYFKAIFEFDKGGSIDITHSLYTVCMEQYTIPSDWVRFAFEVILNLCVVLLSCYTIYLIVIAARAPGGHFTSYFKHGWQILDFISNALLLTTCIMWWVYVGAYAKPYQISLRYDVYPPPLQPQANFLALYNNGAELGPGNGTYTVSSFKNLETAIDLLNWYFALNGINILLLIARVLKLMDFQPRLGVVTRSLWLAGPDLVHFALVAGFIFISYAMMAHLIFGNVIMEFRTFGAAINTCFEMLLGNIDVNGELRALGGLSSTAGALFFWTYELLVYLVLLNFLLAIIVDAFSEVKSNTSETIGIPAELYSLLRDKTRSLMGRFSPNYISDAKLGMLLKQWAGDSAESRSANEEAVVKLIMIMRKGMGEPEIREALDKCRAAAVEEGEEEDLKHGGTRTGRLVSALNSAFGRNGKHGHNAEPNVVASDKDVQMAAKYLVDRFGHKPTGEKAKGDELRLKQLMDTDADRGEVMLARDESGSGGGRTASQGNAGGGGDREAALEEERTQLAQALERLADVQRELADGQRSLMAGQGQLADQQIRLVTLMSTEAQS